LTEVEPVARREALPAAKAECISFCQFRFRKLACELRRKKLEKDREIVHDPSDFLWIVDVGPRFCSMSELSSSEIP